MRKKGNSNKSGAEGTNIRLKFYQVDKNEIWLITFNRRNVVYNNGVLGLIYPSFYRLGIEGGGGVYTRQPIATFANTSRCPTLSLVILTSPRRIAAEDRANYCRANGNLFDIYEYKTKRSIIYRTLSESAYWAIDYLNLRGII